MYHNDITNNTATITTQRELRRMFWAAHPHLPRRRLRDGDYPTDTRVAFCDWLDAMLDMGWIDDAMAQRATLRGAA